ncbi:MAG: recombinase RecA [Myxococcota bacterium]
MDSSGSRSSKGGQVQERAKLLDLAVTGIERQFGKGTVMRLGSADALWQNVEVFSSGSLGLDVALGIGGYPKGRVIEIYGPESSGKTTLALHAIAQIQRQGGTAAFIDAEHALDVKYAKNLGVRTDDMLISQPDCGEQALQVADMLVQSGGLDILVVDSVAALVPKAEIEGEMGDSHMGLQARLMSQALRKLTGTAARSGTCILFINQLRMKIGVVFGNPETTTGGNALKFYASVRLDVRRIGAIKQGDRVVGNRTRVKVVKNKMSPPFREAEFDILYGQGVVKESELLEQGVQLGVLKRSGTWISYGETRLGQGKENARQYLLEHPKLIQDIERRIHEQVGIKALGSPAAANPAS